MSVILKTHAQSNFYIHMYILTLWKLVAQTYNKNLHVGNEQCVCLLSGLGVEEIGNQCLARVYNHSLKEHKITDL